MGGGGRGRARNIPHPPVKYAVRLSRGSNGELRAKKRRNSLNFGQSGGGWWKWMGASGWGGGGRWVGEIFPPSASASLRGVAWDPAALAGWRWKMGAAGLRGRTENVANGRHHGGDGLIFLLSDTVSFRGRPCHFSGRKTEDGELRVWRYIASVLFIGLPWTSATSVGGKRRWRRGIIRKHRGKSD